VVLECNAGVRCRDVKRRFWRHAACALSLADRAIPRLGHLSVYLAINERWLDLFPILVGLGLGVGLGLVVGLGVVVVVHRVARPFVHEIRAIEVHVLAARIRCVRSAVREQPGAQLQSFTMKSGGDIIPRANGLIASGTEQVVVAEGDRWWRLSGARLHL